IVIGFIIVISIAIAGCMSSNHDLNINVEDAINSEGDGSTQVLRVELVSALTNANHALGDRIRKFDEEHPDIVVEFIYSNSDYADISPWALGMEGRGTPPDIVEITHNQM